MCQLQGIAVSRVCVCVCVCMLSGWSGQCVVV